MCDDTRGNSVLAEGVKKKVVLYSAVCSPLDRSKRFKRFAFPGRPVHSDTNLASQRSILARQQLRAKAKSLTCPPLSIARYSFIQLNEQGRQWRERKNSEPSIYTDACVYQGPARAGSRPVGRAGPHPMGRAGLQ